MKTDTTKRHYDWCQAATDGGKENNCNCSGDAPIIMESKPESKTTTIREKDRASDIKLAIDSAWNRIYDYCYRGDGACGFKVFLKALDDAYNRGAEDAKQYD